MGSIYSNILEKITEARNEKGWSQAELGKKLPNHKTEATGVSGEVVSRIEKGTKDITIKDLLDIAEALDKPAAWFFEEDDKTADKNEPTEEPVVRCDSVGDLIKFIEAFENACQSGFMVGTRPTDIYDRTPITVLSFDITDNLAACLNDYKAIRDSLHKTVPKKLLNEMLKTLKNHYSCTPIDDTLKTHNIFDGAQASTSVAVKELRKNEDSESSQT